jgi:hypothetical protein
MQAPQNEVPHPDPALRDVHPLLKVEGWGILAACAPPADFVRPGGPKEFSPRREPLGFDSR